jgi:cytoskeletal protein RodZ
MAFPQANSRDEAHAAIAEAFRLIGQPNENSEKLIQLDELNADKQEANDLFEAPAVEAVEPSSRNRQLLRSFLGLLALVSIGIVFIAWQSGRGQPSAEPIATSSVTINKQETPTAKPTKNGPEVASRTNAAPMEPLLQATTQAAPTSPEVVTMALDLRQQVQMIVRELENLEGGIDQLKAAQAQMVRGNAELANHQKATQEITLRTAELIEDLKAAEAQMARDNNKLAEQLKETQDRMANMAELIKGGQEQLARRVASEQKQRPRMPPATPLANANPARRPLTPPPSAPVRLQAQDAKPNQ